MSYIRTSNGCFKYRSRLLYLGDHHVCVETMVENIRLLSVFLDRIGINWGPAFGTLIGIIRNDGFLPWNPVFDIYILKEEEERFKDILGHLQQAGFELVRYERRGFYYLERHHEYIKVFVLHKIAPDVRHTGGSDFILEKYLQNLVDWDFKGVKLRISQEVDEYLAFRYGPNWLVPYQTKLYHKGPVSRFFYRSRLWLQDHLPDSLYYAWLFRHRQKDFSLFCKKCKVLDIPIPQHVQLANMKPRKYSKVLTVGVYDLLHKGHVELFRRAKGLGDYLIVATQDGEYILKYKPNAKIMNSTDDRKYMIQSIRHVDEVITYTDVDKIVQEIDFDIFVTGPDQCHAGFQRAIQWCIEHGKEHIILGRTEGVSSSELKARIVQKQQDQKK